MAGAGWVDAKGAAFVALAAGEDVDVLVAIVVVK